MGCAASSCSADGFFYPLPPYPCHLYFWMYFFFILLISHICFHSHCLCAFSHGFVVTLGCSLLYTATVIFVCSHCDSFPSLIIRRCSCLLLDFKSTCSALLGKSTGAAACLGCSMVWLWTFLLLICMELLALPCHPATQVVRMKPQSPNK